MHWRLAGRLACSMRSRVLAECRWPWPGGIRLQERLVFALASGLVFIVAFCALLELADLFNKDTQVSLFFPISALWLLFGYAVGPAYLAVPIIGVFLAEALPLPLVFVEGVMLHVLRQGLLYGAAGLLLRSHLGKRGQVTWSYRLGALLCVASVAVLANLLVGLPLFAQDGWLVRAELPSFALTFAARRFERSSARRAAGTAASRSLARSTAGQSRGWSRHVAPLGDRALPPVGCDDLRRDRDCSGFSGETGFPAAVTPALLPILLGATLFGYAVGVSLFSISAALLLAVSASIVDPPSALVLHTVLIVCCVATLAVGAATSDRSRLIAGLDATVAERTRMLDVKNARLTEANAALQTVASTDHLTQLPNRRAFDLAFEDRLAAPDRSLGLLLIDVDRFKRINDRHGHAVGDEALVHVARLLAAALRDGDFLARVGGEEFAVLCRLSGLRRSSRVCGAFAASRQRGAAALERSDRGSARRFGSASVARWQDRATTRTACCGPRTAHSTRPSAPGATARASPVGRSTGRRSSTPRCRAAPS